MGNSWWPTSWDIDWKNIAENAIPGGAIADHWNEIPGDLSQIGGIFSAIGTTVHDIIGPSSASDTPAKPRGPGEGGGDSSASINDIARRLLGGGNLGGGGGGSRGGGSGGSGGGASSGPPQYITPDGVVITEGSPQDEYYKMADALWMKNYGSHPPFSIVQTFRDLHIENTSQLEEVMNGMPSHIKNADGSAVPIGQYNAARTTANTIADKYFGRPVPDNMIQDFFSKGIANPAGIELFFLNHSAKDIPKDVYGQIYDQAAEWTKKTWNDLPHPDHVAQIYNQVTDDGS